MKTSLGVCVAAGALFLCHPGCRKQEGATGHSHGAGGHDHAAEAEVKTAQITVWTNGYEIFAEHTAQVAGRGTRFITHVSEIMTGKPKSSGAVKFVLRQGATSFDHPQAGPDRPGIYIPAITFPKEGDWETTIIIPGATNAMVNLGTIRVFANDDAAAKVEFPDAPEGISFLKEQQWKLLLRSEAVSPRTLVERVSVAAEVRSRPGAAAAVIAPLSGQLVSMGENKSLLPGARVEAGEVMALVRPRFSEAAARYFETRAELEAASAALKQAESAYQRTKSLLEVEAKSRRDLEEAEVALAAARARHSGSAALHTNYSQAPGTNGAPATIEIRAPIGGVVTTVAAGVGEPVAADNALFTILDLSRVWIEARVPESALARLGAAKDALCQLLDGSQRQFSISAEQGKLVFSGLEVDPQTRTVPIIYEINNTNAALRRGQSVR